MSNQTPDTGEKLFTQEDVNRIVQDRLAKEKAKFEVTLADREKELVEREQAFQRKELTAQATARLTACGINEDALALIDFSSADAMERTLKIIEKTVPKMSGGAGFAGKQPPGLIDSGVRDAMGLGKGG